MPTDDQAELNLWREIPKGSLADYLRQGHAAAAASGLKGQGIKTGDKANGRSEATTSRRGKRRRRNGTIVLHLKSDVAEVPPVSPQDLQQMPCDDWSPTSSSPATPIPYTSSIFSGFDETFTQDIFTQVNEVVPVPLLIDHYLQNVARPIPALDQGRNGILRELWFPMAMQEPALFLVILLASGSHLALSRMMDFSGASPDPNAPFDPRYALLTLKRHALRHVNLLLSHPSRARHAGDSAFAAVIELANYEVMYGDEETFRTHMDGLSSMLEVRGSWRSLEYALDGLLHRMIVRVDANAMHILRLRRRLRHQEL